MDQKDLIIKDLLDNNQALKSRIEELEDVIEAIRSGQVDAVVASPEAGGHIFSLQGAEKPYRVFIENMNQGAITLSSDEIILYCNQRFSELSNTPMEQIIGSSLDSFFQGS